MKKKIFLFSIALFLSILCIPSFFKIFNIKVKKKQNVTRPNILLVTVCSLRQDHLGCYGYSRLTSLNIDKLAKTSTLFTNCYTHKPWTIAATRSLLTGKYPSTSLDVSKEIKLTELLRSAGYKVFGVIGTYAVRKINLNVGFDQFYGPRDLGNLEATSHSAHDVRASVVANKAIEILKSEKTNASPIFLWVFFKDPHWKYMPPDPYKGLFLNDELYSEQIQQLKINEDIYNSFGGIGRARLEYPDGRFVTNKAYYISQYDAEIFFMDKHIGELIQYIKSTDSFNDWLVIFIADHGESLGEDDYFFDHGGTISDATARIPLMVKIPGQTKAKTVEDLTSICDIYPTIMELVGV